MANTQVEVIGGVDTHKDTHHAAVLDTQGRRLGSRQFPADDSGYERMLEWMRTFGNPIRVAKYVVDQRYNRAPYRLDSSDRRNGWTMKR
ncbi:transposase [Nocardia sp. NPDC058499]|uniref:IS110 family transposase n=1 Tax=Nocardia sp. NPDC058499 TaxID=3346530 RepID=UPI00364BA7F6